MSGFENLRQKMRKIFEEKRFVAFDFSLKKNKDNKLSGENNIIKAGKILHDTGFVAGRTTSVTSFSSINKGDLLPAIFNYVHEVDLELPEDLLPFVKVDVQARQLVDSKIDIHLFPEISSWDKLDKVRIKGNGSLLYQGFPITQTINTPIGNSVDKSKDPKDGGLGIPAGNLKKMWRVNINWTDQFGDKWRASDVFIKSIRVVEDIGFTCNQQTNSFDCSPAFPNITESNKNRNLEEFHDITDSSFDTTFRRTETLFTFVDPACLPQSNIVQGIRRTFTWPELDQLIIRGNAQKFIDGEYIEQGINDYIIAIGSGDIITFKKLRLRKDELTPIDYIFYSSDRRWLLSIPEVFSLEDDGIFNRRELNPLPNITEVTEISLPYTTIRLERNKNDMITFTEFNTGELTQSLRTTNKTTWVLLDEKILPVSPKINRYRLFHTGNFFVSYQAFGEQTIDFPRYDDTYTAGSLTYSKSESHDINQKINYFSESKDIDSRFLVAIVPPFEYHETKKFKD